MNTDEELRMFDVYVSPAAKERFLDTLATFGTTRIYSIREKIPYFGTSGIGVISEYEVKLSDSERVLLSLTFTDKEVWIGPINRETSYIIG